MISTNDGREHRFGLANPLDVILCIELRPDHYSRPEHRGVPALVASFAFGVSWTSSPASSQYMTHMACGRTLIMQEFYIPESKKFHGVRYSSHVNVDVVRKLNDKLSKLQLEMFRKTIFGYFLDMPEVYVQNQVLVNLMRRELVQERNDLFCVKINESSLCFGLKEFGIITGLRCFGDDKFVGNSNGVNRLRSNYFGENSSVSLDDLVSCFEDLESIQSDDDAVKIAILYFIYTFLFSGVGGTTTICNRDLELVESGEYHNFPWGIVVFKALLKSVRDKMYYVKSFHRFGGFPLALQLWVYECCSSVSPEIAYRVARRVPRILNWKVVHQMPSTKLLEQSLFSKSNDKVWSNISPAVDELGVLNLPTDNVYQFHRTQKKFKTPMLNKKVCKKVVKADKKVCKLAKELPTLRNVKEVSVVGSLKKVSIKHDYNNNNHPVMISSEKSKVPAGSFSDYVLLTKFDKKMSRMHDENNNNHHSKNCCVNSRGAAAADCSNDYVLRTEFDKFSSEFESFKKYVKTSLHRLTVKSNSKEHIGVQNFFGDSDPTGLQHSKFECAIEDGRRSKERDTSPVQGILQSSSGDCNLLSDSQLMIAYDQSAILYSSLRDKVTSELIPYEVTNVDEVLHSNLKKKSKISGICQNSSCLTDFGSFECSKVKFDSKKNDQDRYCKGRGELKNAFLFGDISIRSRDWFHKLNYGGSFLDDTHIDVVLYYLRKRAKYGVELPIRFTTTNFLFAVKVKSLHDFWIDNNKDYGVLYPDHEIAAYILGFYMPCNDPWHIVDYILIPICVYGHWILAILSFKDRIIYIYDSMRGARHDAKIRSAVEPFAIVIPYFLSSTDFYRKKQDLNVNQPHYSDKSPLQPLDIQFVDGLPIQYAADCGIYLVSFAEYFIHNIQIPRDDFNVPEGLELGITTMPRGEKAVIYVKSQYYSESTLMPVVEGVDEVHFEVELVHFIQVRDVLGDGRLIKRRIHDGRGEFPMDCPLQDSLLSVHYQGFLLNEEKMVFYDKSERTESVCSPCQLQDRTGFSFPEIMDDVEKIKGTGNRLFKEGKFELAKAKYEKNLLHLNVAACLLKLGEHKKSIEACNKVLDANPVHVKALYRCGMAYMASGDFEEARADFNKMMSIDKSSEGSAKAAPLKLKKEEQKPGLMTGDEATSENLEKDDLDYLDDHEERTRQTTAPPPPPGRLASVSDANKNHFWSYLNVVFTFPLQRQEFDLEYDNDVEQLLADMESKETETEEERELKLREARAAGCCSSAEVDRYIERKRKREVEGDVPRKESSQIGLLIQESLNMPASSDSLGTHSNRKPCSQVNFSSIIDSGVVAFSA
ncbi:Peptidyl-prolyl cis-trans isomerase PASTICCINO1 [Capsicum annuum]|nr:Peptidyl-prolyl cis-trans isomerase PASTICCINO1 [Capsicum annuum]